MSGKKAFTYIAGENINWYNLYRGHFESYLSKLKCYTGFDSAVSLLGIDHRKIITHVGNYVKYIHCNMFAMAKDWKQFAN